MAKIVIVGGSVAGNTVARELRNTNKECLITLVTEEQYPFYDKRMILDFIAGNKTENDLFILTEDYYKQNGINFIKQNPVCAVNSQKRIVYLKDKEKLEYDFLVICSGAKPVLPEIPGIKKPGVTGLYNLSDFKKLASHLAQDAVCLVGSGKLAFDIAKVLAKKDKEVKLLTSADFDNSENPPKLEIIRGSLTEIIGESEAQAIRIESGKIIAASLVGIIDSPEACVEFLKNAGVGLSRGYIVVDEGMRTNLENIYACGQVCRNKDSDVKLKSWDDCASESKILVENILPLA